MSSQPPVQYQISGVLMLISGFFNGFLSLMWFVMLIWLCVGVMWLIPLTVACVEIVIGILVLAGVRVPGVQVVSILGAINSMFLFNMWGAIMEGIAAVLQFQPQVTGYLEGEVAD
ncbi:MAG: hypothetical protein H6737_15860 [Alphaproteobacteria bacterium]|nr:hypothetical protein [Alphaproteobacteria bacterium]